MDCKRIVRHRCPYSFHIVEYGGRYAAMSKADPDAIWLMQAWLFQVSPPSHSSLLRKLAAHTGLRAPRTRASGRSPRSLHISVG
eukprot:COSAG03_NODE_157_length_11420_cov_28.022083_2_plen_84_part_00